MYRHCDLYGLLKGIFLKKILQVSQLCSVLMRLPDYRWMNEALYKYLNRFI